MISISSQLSPMYTPTIVEKKFQSGTLSIAVKFSDTDDSFVEWFSTRSVANPSWLNDAVRNRLEEINACKGFSVPPDIDTSPPPVSKITTEEKIKRKWLQDLRKLNQLQSLVGLGIISPDNPELVAKKDSLKASYQTSFSDLV